MDQRAAGGMVADEGLASHVRFLGWVPHENVQEIARDSSVFLFPSVREFGGGAVLEAMALGLVPVVVDYGGPGELVNSDRGIAVPLGSAASIVTALREALHYLAGNPAKVASLGARSREWAMAMLTSEAKARMMVEIYAWAMGDRLEKPNLF